MKTCALFTLIKTTFRGLFVCLIVTTPLVENAKAENSLSIGWADLIPATKPLKSPFERLKPQEREDVSYILRTRADLQSGLIDTASPEVRKAEEIFQRLSAAGFDYSAFETQMSAFDADVGARARAVVTQLDGRMVRIPGYALPLEFTENGVSEFLLVPFVGACIHVPPPPPNQMVFVKLNQEYRLRGLYEPIWIVGRLSVEHAERSLFLVDGQSSVVTGYSLQGISLEPYQ